MTIYTLNATIINSTTINTSHSITTSNLNSFTANLTDVFIADYLSIGRGHSDCVSLNFDKPSPDAAGLLYLLVTELGIMEQVTML